MMNFFIILILAVVCHEMSFASPSFKASTIKNSAFDANRMLGDNLINNLTLVQQEILFSLLLRGKVSIGHADGHHKSKWHIIDYAGDAYPIDNSEFRGHASLPRSLQVVKSPIDNSKLSFMDKVATRQGYEQLLRDRGDSTNNLMKEKDSLDLMNIWKVNLHEVMPSTAALTYEDFIESPKHRRNRRVGAASGVIETAVNSVISLVATGHEDIIEFFKNSDVVKHSDILYETFKRYYLLKYGKEDMRLQFSDLLRTYKERLQARRERIAERRSQYSDELPLSSYAKIGLVEQEAEITILGLHISAMERIVGDTNAITAYFVDKAMDDYNADVKESDNHDYIKLNKNDLILSAQIDDLGFEAWRTLSYVERFSRYYENFFELLAQVIADDQAVVSR